MLTLQLSILRATVVSGATLGKERPECDVQHEYGNLISCSTLGEVSIEPPAQNFGEWGPRKKSFNIHRLFVFGNLEKSPHLMKEV